MTKRPSGWYWIKDDPTDDWQVAEWDIDGGYLWIIGGDSRRADPDIIGPRIGSPDEMTSEDAIAASVAGAQAEKRHLLLAEQQTMDKALRKSMKIIHEGRAQGGQEPSAEAIANMFFPIALSGERLTERTEKVIAIASLIDAFAARKVIDAVAQERERCAKIAEKWQKENNRRYGDDIGFEIAAAIRKNKPAP